MYFLDSSAALRLSRLIVTVAGPIRVTVPEDKLLPVLRVPLPKRLIVPPEEKFVPLSTNVPPLVFRPDPKSRLPAPVMTALELLSPEIAGCSGFAGVIVNI